MSLSALTITCLVGLAGPAAAQEDAPPDPDASESGSQTGLGYELAADTFEDQLRRVQIHGFASQGFILSFENNYLADSQEGSFEFSEVGLNFTSQPVDDLRIGMQLFTRDLGPTGNYEARFDWFYLDYRFADAFGIRVGRTKVPFGLYNELNDIDVARVPILLPQALYPTSSRDFLLAQTGAEIYGRVPLGTGGLEYRIYGGTVFVPIPPPAGSPFEVTDVRWPYLLGGRLLWETPLQGLTLGASVQAFRLETDALLANYVIVTDPATGAQSVVPANIPVTLALPAILWVASAEYLVGDVQIAAEYSRWSFNIESSNTSVFPEQETNSERLYAMVADRLTDWFQPGVYYSLIFPDVDDRRGREAYQHDAALTMRFDINDHWLFKAEGHYVYGTADLSSSLNDNVPLSELSSSWGVLLLKTTAYF